MEGISHEAILIAGHLAPQELIVLLPDNTAFDRWQHVRLSTPTIRQRASSVRLGKRCDRRHDTDQIAAAIARAQQKRFARR